MNQATMAAEIAAMEQELQGNPPVETPEAALEETPVAPVTEPVVEPAVEPTEVAEATVEPAEPVVEPEVPSLEVELEAAKKRFNNFKASSDATVHGLRQQAITYQEDLVKMQEIIKTLTEQVNTLSTKSDPYDGLFTDAEKDLIGEETLAAMAKANKAALEAGLKPLQAKIDKTEEESQARRTERLEREKRELAQTFFTRLEAKVPNFRKTDTDPKFLEYMQEADEDSGYPRAVIFKRAQANGDVGRCAEFMLTYRRLSEPVDKLAGKVTPVSSATGKAPVPPKPTAPQITPAFIDDFYARAIRGEYKGKEKERQAIEKQIDDHIRSLSGQY